MFVCFVVILCCFCYVCNVCKCILVKVEMGFFFVQMCIYVVFYGWFFVWLMFVCYCVLNVVYMVVNCGVNMIGEVVKCKLCEQGKIIKEWV